jgi:hypothetical protein
MNFRMKQAGPVGTKHFPFNFNFQAPAEHFLIQSASYHGEVSCNQTPLVSIRVFCHSILFTLFSYISSSSFISNHLADTDTIPNGWQKTPIHPFWQMTGSRYFCKESDLINHPLNNLVVPSVYLSEFYASESKLTSKSDAIHRLWAHTLTLSLALTHLSLSSLFLSLTLQPSRLSLPRWHRTRLLTAA